MSFLLLQKCKTHTKPLTWILRHLCKNLYFPANIDVFAKCWSGPKPSWKTNEDIVFFFRWIWHLRLFQLEYIEEISNSSNTLHTLVRHVIPTGQRWTKPYDMMWFAHHTRLWFAIELGRILEDLHCQEAVIRQVMLRELHGPATEGWKVIIYWSFMDFQPVGLQEKRRRIRETIMGYSMLCLIFS